MRGADPLLGLVRDLARRALERPALRPTPRRALVGHSGGNLVAHNTCAYAGYGRNAPPLGLTPGQCRRLGDVRRLPRWPADKVAPSPVAILIPLPLTGRVGIEVEGSAAAITPTASLHAAGTSLGPEVEPAQPTHSVIRGDDGFKPWGAVASAVWQSLGGIGIPPLPNVHSGRRQ